MLLSQSALHVDDVLVVSPRVKREEQASGVLGALATFKLNDGPNTLRANLHIMRSEIRFNWSKHHGALSLTTQLDPIHAQDWQTSQHCEAQCRDAVEEHRDRT